MAARLLPLRLQHCAVACYRRAHASLCEAVGPSPPAPPPPSAAFANEGAQSTRKDPAEAPNARQSRGGSVSESGRWNKSDWTGDDGDNAWRGFSGSAPGETWMARYRELMEYEGRHAEIPQPYSDNPVLARWVGTQRTRYAKGRLSRRLVVMLEELGFVWEPLELVWRLRLLELREYREKHGHCRVPNRSEENQELATWVREKRHRRALGLLAAERVAQLDEVGFEWQPWDSDWHARLQELRAFREEHGHCLVPQRFKENEALGNWVKHQRLHARGEGRLSDEQVRLLEAEGFVWEPREAAWQMKLGDLKRFKAKTGHCRVAPGCKGAAPGLRSWMAAQRSRYHARKLKQERVAALEALGFEWGPFRHKRTDGQPTP